MIGFVPCSSWSSATSTNSRAKACSNNKLVNTTKTKTNVKSTVVMLGNRDELGRVMVATPFGIIRRDPDTLPPMVSKAAEMSANDFTDQTRLRELELKLQENRSDKKLSALQELCFFPPDQALPLFAKTLDTSNDELARSQSVFGCSLFFDNPQQEAATMSYETVVKALLNDSSPTVRSSAAGALGYVKTGKSQTVKLLARQLLEDDDWLTKLCLSVSLGMLGDPTAVDILLPELKKYNPAILNDDTLILQGIIGALGQLKAVSALDEFQRWVNNPDRFLRTQLAESLYNFEDPRALSMLNILANDNEESVKRQARMSIEFLQERSGGKQV
eukprot:CAMPEP_0184693032 /NCGR_PEP_ID=MMETSP0313-20130426/1336_1 /TAXON_ID=2792 /ORGANISM="Porphyridium aerugineum, Strain SAG 1380-2" /LENGTH=330 /DNA_ID=CAMNT_0027150985 /DNA_START=175 /DNA_END=1167 /DNA_ORIENTATION=+